MRCFGFLGNYDGDLYVAFQFAPSFRPTLPRLFLLVGFLMLLVELTTEVKILYSAPRDSVDLALKSPHPITAAVPESKILPS